MARTGEHAAGIYPGYAVALVATIAFFATAPGQTFVISLLNEPLRTAYGMSELTLNTSYTVATVLASLPLVLIGSMTDRIGPRRMLAIIAFAFGLSCLFMSVVAGTAMVFVGFFLLRFFGQGALALVSQHALAMWFHRRLGSLHGMKLVIVFAFWILVPQGAVRLMDLIGWRQTYALFALVIWLSVIPLALWLVRNRPEDLGLRMDNDHPRPDESNLDSRGHIAGTDESPKAEETLEEPAPAFAGIPGAAVEPPGAIAPHEPAFTLAQAKGTRAYWTIASAVFLPPLIGTAFLFDMQPILDMRGMTRLDAANAVSIWTATMCIMALPSGALTDRARPNILFGFGMAMIGASALLLWTARGMVGVGAALATFGVGQSIVAACGLATTARYFGRAHHGAIRSSIMRIGVIGTGLGPIFTALSVESTGGYAAAMVVFALMCVPVVVAGLMLREPIRPLGAGS